MNDAAGLVHSLVDWWRLAGVEWDYSETPNDWLADDPHPATRRASADPGGQRPSQPVPQPLPLPAKPVAPPAAELVLPTDLAAFQQAWARGALGADGGDGAYLAPSGPLQPAVMVMAFAPERDDRGTVLSGKAGALITNIARAAGIPADRVYRASYFPRVVHDGRAAAGHLDHWRRVTLHHIALVQPETLVVAGEDTARALLGHDPSQIPPVLHFLNHGGQTIKTAVMRKPSLMFHRIAPEKAMAWQSWQLLLLE